MPQLWQCDVCGAQYRVGYLSHCYRCEALPRPPRQPAKLEKPARRKRMPRIVAGVGPSNARAAQEQPEPVEQVVAPAEEAPVVEPEGTFDVVQGSEPEPVEVVAEPVVAAAETFPVAAEFPAAPELDAPVDGAQ